MGCCFAPAGFVGSRDRDGTDLPLDLRKNALLIQPDLQNIIRPGGTDHLKNALVFGINF